MTFKDHVAQWIDCQRCQLCEDRDRVVLARGQIPCDALFVGEAPGESENVLGRPFCGPAGYLLDDIIERSLEGNRAVPRFPLRVSFTNLVACIPREDGGKATEPDDESIEACRPRLEQFIALAQPRLIVSVGSLARDWLAQGYRYSIRLPQPLPAQIEIIHPAAILRANSAQQSLMVRKCVVTLTNAFAKL